MTCERCDSGPILANEPLARAAHVVQLCWWWKHQRARFMVLKRRLSFLFARIKREDACQVSSFR